MSTPNESLSKIHIFASVPESALVDVQRRCRWRRYTPNEEIVSYLDDSCDVFFLVEGQVRAVIYSVTGKEVTFRDLGVGEHFGEFAAIDGKPRSATVVALQDSLVASMTPEVFRDTLRNHPSVAEAVLRDVVNVARMLSDRVLEFSTLAVKNRIQAELLRLARACMTGENTALVSPAPTHGDIASRVSTHREAVTRELGALDRAGIVERSRKGLLIRDVGRLARMVQEVIGEEPH